MENTKHKEPNLHFQEIQALLLKIIVQWPTEEISSGFF